MRVPRVESTSAEGSVFNLTCRLFCQNLSLNPHLTYFTVSLAYSALLKFKMSQVQLGL